MTLSPYLERRLAKRKVRLVNEETMELICDICRTGWRPIIRRGGKLGYGWYKCPNGCNAVQKSNG